MSKFCPYCMRPHERLGRCCCPEHERRIAAHISGVNMGHARALARIHGRQERLFVSRRRWRDVAAGRDVAARLREIFGFTPEGEA